MNPSVRAAVFLDRDGTIVRDVDFLRTPAEIEVLPGAIEGLRALREAGFALVVVSNQSGIARGFFDERALAAIEADLAGRLAAAGAAIDAWYYCPHLEGAPLAAYDVACRCRKPAPGLILRAAAEMRLDLGRSYLVGDGARDVEAGRAAGVRAALRIGDGEGADVPDLAAAARWILRDREARVDLGGPV